MSNSVEASTITASDQPEIIKESRAQPVWHVIVLIVFTLGAYILIWFYVTTDKLAKRLDPEAKGTDELKQPSIDEKNSLELTRRIKPIFWFFGIPLPFINLLLSFLFFKMLAEIYPSKDSFVRKLPVLMGIALTALLVGTMCLGTGKILPDPYRYVYLFAFIAPAIGQHWLNRYWSSIEPEGLLTRHSFSTFELVMLILGIGLVGLIIANFMIVPFH